MKYLLAIPAILGIAVTIPFSLKAYNSTASNIRENTARLDNETTQNISSTEYADYYYTLMPQPELIPREETNILEASLGKWELRNYY